jgi:hypothetical protein
LNIELQPQSGYRRRRLFALRDVQAKVRAGVAARLVLVVMSKLT